MYKPYQQRLKQLQATLKDVKPPFRLKKGTTSNLFRYTARTSHSNSISLADFHHVLHIDTQAMTAQVEGLATIETVVDATLAHGLLPKVSPELKHITIGGATVGIGIESSCARYGFVHDMLVEADVLLGDGRIVTCRADNEYADLFHALPNSYGSLGYILRAVIELVAAKPFVKVTNKRYHDSKTYLAAMQQAVAQNHEFVEGLFFNKEEFYLTTAELVDDAPRVENIFRTIYYKLLRQDATLFLRTKDYIFRYDPDWFWNVPETGFYKWFRKFAPIPLRSSKFYNRYCAIKNRWLERLKRNSDDGTEQLIQDWEVPWDKAQALIDFALEQVNLHDQPWVALPIKTPHQPTIYPLKANTLYFNLGCYCLTPRPKDDEPFYYTKIMDRQCFDLGGLKMLYSSTFIDEDEFNTIYNGKGYSKLKQKYDPQGFLPSLQTKALAGG